MMNVLERIGQLGIVPVVKIDRPEQAAPLAEAICAGGLPIAEITFRTEHAAEAIRSITSSVPQMLVGAGTVLTCEQVDRALDAGARFIVSPGFNEKVVRHCIDRNVPVTPGCSNPSDIERAIECGLDIVKFFPAEPLGGLNYIKAVAGPYPQIKFMPTGGIGPHNLCEYLANEKIHACGGSWMVPSKLIAAGDYQGVTSIVREAVSLLLGVTLKHIGINEPGEEAALGTAAAFSGLLFAPVKNGNSSVFAGTAIEVMKKPFLGAHGHIALGVNSIPRALAYLSDQGILPDMTTAKKDDAGRIKAVYLQGEIGGFAVHLLSN